MLLAPYNGGGAASVAGVRDGHRLLLGFFLIVAVELAVIIWLIWR